MALVDPYSLCPCGSGQKYKWCCQKVEAYAERAQRLVDNGQYESALQPLEEGLAKVPGSPWLLTKKALVQLQSNQTDAGKLTLRALLQNHPDNLTGSILLTRLVLETEGPIAGVAQFQQCLSANRARGRGPLGSLASLIGRALAQAGICAAALAHLELADRLGDEEQKQNSSLIPSLKANPGFSPWEKNPYRLWPAPEHASPPFRESFERALSWASEGLWSSAASAFELLAAGSGSGTVADRNRGLCCLWLADHDGAVAALRRYIARSGPTLDAIDLETLCQKIEVRPPRDQVEFVHLSWPIRNREGLLAALRGSKFLHEGPDRSLDPDDPKSPEMARFFLLDRPGIEQKPGLTRLEIPMILGEVLVGPNTVFLETYDDGRLDRLVDQLTATVGTNIPPAHPRTKIIGKEQRHLLALSWRWQVPEGIAEEEADRLHSEQSAYLISTVWPETRHPALRWRTPLEAVKAGDSETPLRAAVRLLQESPAAQVDLVDWDQLRAKLKLPPEPAVDPDRVEIDQLHLSRLALVAVEQLDDDRILALYRRAREWGIRPVANRAARLIDARPTLMVKGEIEAPTLYGELALDAAGRNDRSQALFWIARGRDSEPPLTRSAHALIWELIELQVRMALEKPDVWVKSLAVLLDRYRGNQEATSALFLRLISLGLVQVVTDPNRPDQLGLDTRILDSYLNRFGPRVTTSSGQLRVAASQGEIWTPESGGGGSTSIWTPGSAPPLPSAGGKAKIIVTGQ